jgi:uncharacterized protein YdhG (YjbR/CyaY superfamily)
MARKKAGHTEYIAAFPAPVRRKLKEMHALIFKEVPEAQEAIRYGVAAFLLPEGPLVYIAGFKKHVSFFPTSSGVRAFQKELSSYKTSKGTIQFSLAAPLPIGLLRRIIRFRLEEVQGKERGRSSCDSKGVSEFDYSKLAQELRILSRPAQRALINAGLFSPARIARKSEGDLLKLHGLGPTSMPVIRKVLAARALKLKGSL